MNTHQLLKSWALRLPSKIGFYPTRLSDPKNVADIIAELRPVTSSAMSLIRFGGDTDGGYLVPDDFDGISACFSPGVDQSSTFEIDCANRDMKVFMADASVDGPAADHASFSFMKKFVGSATNGEFITLDDWVSESNIDANSELILQMDIEGFEYETLLSTSSALLSRIRILVIEFHKLDMLLSATTYPFVAACLRKLLQTHAVVHIHPNNVSPIVKRGALEIPQTCEFTFLRRDRITNPYNATTFPHPLDRECCELPSCPLPASWYE